MAARGAVAAWDGGSMPEAKKAVTKAKAEAIIKIAEGKQDELGQDELALVGLHRENDGSFSQGYYDAKGKWQKRPAARSNPRRRGAAWRTGHHRQPD